MVLITEPAVLARWARPRPHSSKARVEGVGLKICLTLSRWLPARRFAWEIKRDSFCLSEVPLLVTATAGNAETEHAGVRP